MPFEIQECRFSIRKTNHFQNKGLLFALLLPIYKLSVYTYSCDFAKQKCKLCNKMFRVVLFRRIEQHAAGGRFVNLIIPPEGREA